MNDLISKDKFLTALIQCKRLTVRDFEIVAEFLKDYPVDVNMDNIKKDIQNMSAYTMYNLRYIRENELMEILDKGGI